MSSAALLDFEKPWAARYGYLRDHGYILRPRYRPGWKGRPSTAYDEDEESLTPINELVLDAVRASDGRRVFLKLIDKRSQEAEICRRLTALKDDPRNHSIPIMDIIGDSVDQRKEILVMPILRTVSSPRLHSIRECVDFIEQTLEGLVFLHEHGVAHRDCVQRNIMMDARKLFPQGWHAQRPHRYVDGKLFEHGLEPSRTAVGGVRYYFVDFGLSSIGEKHVTGADGLEEAPELSDDVPYDPFQLDVYILGMVFRRFIVEAYSNTQFLMPLVQPMVSRIPSARPTATSAYSIFQEIKSKFGLTDLGQRLHPATDRNGQNDGTEPSLILAVGDLVYRVSDYWWTATATKGDPPLV